jgi:hypothetical protein
VGFGDRSTSNLAQLALPFYFMQKNKLYEEMNFNPVQPKNITFTT